MERSVRVQLYAYGFNGHNLSRGAMANFSNGNGAGTIEWVSFLKPVESGLTCVLVLGAMESRGRNVSMVVSSGLCLVLHASRPLIGRFRRGWEFGSVVILAIYSVIGLSLQYRSWLLD